MEAMSTFHKEQNIHTNMSEIIDSYSEIHSDNNGPLNIVGAALGQTFTGNGDKLVSAAAYLSKSASPSGNIYICIYSHTGTWGTSGIPDQLLATSDPIDASTLSGSLAIIPFNFSGANKITLQNGTHYCMAVQFDGDTTNYVNVGFDDNSPTHPGNKFYLHIGWHAQSNMDLIFYVYGEISSASASASASLSPSASQSPSASFSPSSSVSASISQSSSLSPSSSGSASQSASLSPSASASPSEEIPNDMYIAQNTVYNDEIKRAPNK